MRRAVLALLLAGSISLVTAWQGTHKLPSQGDVWKPLEDRSHSQNGWDEVDLTYEEPEASPEPKKKKPAPEAPKPKPKLRAKPKPEKKEEKAKLKAAESDEVALDPKGAPAEMAGKIAAAAAAANNLPIPKDADKKSMSEESSAEEKARQDANAAVNAVNDAVKNEIAKTTQMMKDRLDGIPADMLPERSMAKRRAEKSVDDAMQGKEAPDILEAKAEMGGEADGSVEQGMAAVQNAATS